VTFKATFSGIAPLSVGSKPNADTGGRAESVRTNERFASCNYWDRTLHAKGDE
jgi:hypothetical protein